MLDAPRALPEVCPLSAPDSHCCGRGSAFGYPPFGLWPLACFRLACWAFSCRARELEAGRLIGWLGLVAFSVANNWIATAFTHQAKCPLLN